LNLKTKIRTQKKPVFLLLTFEVKVNRNHVCIYTLGALLSDVGRSNCFSSPLSAPMTHTEHKAEREEVTEERAGAGPQFPPDFKLTPASVYENPRFPRELFSTVPRGSRTTFLTIRLAATMQFLDFFLQAGGKCTGGRRPGLG
jgi:hypothetical protein